MDLKSFCQSKACKRALIGVAGVVVLLVDFQAGLFVGYHKAEFSNRWGNEYEHMFGERRGGPRPPEFMNPQGAVGRIVSVSLPTFVLADKDGTEKSVLIGDETAIRRLRETLTSADLKVGDSVVTFGEPDDDGQIKATLIRVFSSSPAPLAAPIAPSGMNF